jgi:hypothetical protein
MGTNNDMPKSGGRVVIDIDRDVVAVCNSRHGKNCRRQTNWNQNSNSQNVEELSHTEYVLNRSQSLCVNSRASWAQFFYLKTNSPKKQDGKFAMASAIAARHVRSPEEDRR